VEIGGDLYRAGRRAGQLLPGHSHAAVIPARRGSGLICGAKREGGRQQILSFYKGKNTPERKDYIMENLVVTVEE